VVTTVQKRMCKRSGSCGLVNMSFMTWRRGSEYPSPQATKRRDQLPQPANVAIQFGQQQRSRPPDLILCWTAPITLTKRGTIGVPRFSSARYLAFLGTEPKLVHDLIFCVR